MIKIPVFKPYALWLNQNREDLSGRLLKISGHQKNHRCSRIKAGCGCGRNADVEGILIMENWFCRMYCKENSSMESGERNGKTAISFRRADAFEKVSLDIMKAEMAS